jgi:hypothetical protein
MFGVMDTGMKTTLVIAAAALITLVIVAGRWLTRR